MMFVSRYVVFKQVSCYPLLTIAAVQPDRSLGVRSSVLYIYVELFFLPCV